MHKDAESPESKAFQILRDLQSAKAMRWIAALTAGVLAAFLPGSNPFLGLLAGITATVVVFAIGDLLAYRLFREHQFAKLTRLVEENSAALEYLKKSENPLAMEYLNVRAAYRVPLPEYR